MANPQKRTPVGLTLTEIRAALADSPWSDKPILTVEEASELTRTPANTLYDWRSRGLLDDCSARPGKSILFFRDKLIQHIFDSKHEPK